MPLNQAFQVKSTIIKKQAQTQSYFIVTGNIYKLMTYALAITSALQNNAAASHATLSKDTSTSLTSDEQRHEKTSEKLQSSSQVAQHTNEPVLAAVTQDGDALEYASDELNHDEKDLLAALTQNGDALKYASPELRHNKEVVLAAVTQDGYALEYASKTLQDELSHAGDNSKSTYMVAFFVLLAIYFYRNANANANPDDNKIPDEFICPINSEIMNEPSYFEGDQPTVHRCEQSALVEWHARSHSILRPETCKNPMTGLQVNINSLRIDLELKNKIRQFNLSGKNPSIDDVSRRPGF
ncbi:MAG: DUF4116 domain-containing protein [Gammaproteobacteria bacterium]|nr:DUF4116 domain-containing protein [Gammaproteobacteria bacterium]MCH9764340.1 DUF4116 domain-containing protein [Gammaproteobacteria bacterium]